MPTLTPAVEICDGLRTHPTPVVSLHLGSYVLFADDVEEADDEPVLVAADHPFPVLWRFAAIISQQDDGVTMLFDAPGESLELTIAYTGSVREVMPGQDHERWDPAPDPVRARRPRPETQERWWAGRRISHTLPVGATAVEADKTTWTKIHDRMWETGDGRQCNNAAMDTILAEGGQIVRQVVNLDTEPVQATVLEAGEYVVLSFGWWHEPAGKPVFDPGAEHVAQQLWRVAGWTGNDPRSLTLLLDAPEDLLRWVNHLTDPDAGWETRAFERYVEPGDVFHVVLPGQKHERWDEYYNWSYEFILVDPPH